MSYLDYTSEDLAQRNGARLLAQQIQTLQIQYNESARRHDTQLRAIRAELTKAEKIGLAVMDAKRAGRKTVRIDTLLEES